MAKKPTVTTITSGYASNTQLNANFTALRNAFDNTLSLDGSTPNAMAADLDLNNNDILNVNALEVVALRVDGEDLDLSGVATLAPISADIVTLAQLQDGTVLLYGLSDLHAVKDDIAALGPVSGAISTVASIDTEVVAVNGLSSEITTVAGISSDVTSVAAVDTDVTAVAAITSDVTAVAAVDTDVTAVAGVASNVTTVAGISANVTTVSGIAANVTTVAGIAANVTTVAGNSANVTTVAGISANVTTVATDIANVNTVATNINSVNNFADSYVVSATEPASPVEGMLWFDTSTDTMKVYNGSSFQNAGSSVNGTSERNVYTATSGQTSFAATYDAGFVDVYLNGVKLVDGTDFTATNGSSVVLAVGATTGDIVDIVAYGTFSLANVYTQAASDARYVQQTDIGVTVQAYDADTAKLDVAQTFTANQTVSAEFKATSYNETYVSLSGTTPSVDCETGNMFALSTSGNTTFTFSNPPANGTAYGFTLKVTAGGTHTLTWPASVDWAGGTAPDAPASGETNVLVFITHNGGTTWYGFLAGAALA